MQLQIKSSRIEFGVVASCHFAALLSLAQIELARPLLLLIGLFIVASLLCYCLDGVNLAAMVAGRCKLPIAVAGGAGWQGLFRPRRHLLLGAQYGLLRIATREMTLSPPRICYYSEFLIVLKFEPFLPPSSRQLRGRSRRLVFWPDSLSAAEDRRLRRYLRFDCPQPAP